MHQQLKHRIVQAGAILLCLGRAGVAHSQTVSPDLKQSLQFVANGLRT